jgi:hypothetical protein
VNDRYQARNTVGRPEGLATAVGYLEGGSEVVGVALEAAKTSRCDPASVQGCDRLSQTVGEMRSNIH